MVIQYFIGILMAESLLVTSPTVNPWSPDGPFMVQKMVISFPILVFKGLMLTSWDFLNLQHGSPEDFRQDVVLHADMPCFMQLSCFFHYDLRVCLQIN